MEVQVLKIEDSEYHARPEISQSQLCDFITEPKDFEFHHILANKNTSNDTKSTSLGSAVHKWYLEQKDFWNCYYKQDFKFPANAQQKGFAAAVFNTEFPRDLLTAYKTFYSAKGSDNVLGAAAKELYESIKGYGTYLKNGKGKPCITDDQFAEVQLLYTYAQQHKEAKRLLFDIEPGMDYDNEIVIFWKHPDYDIPLRCKIDRIRIDPVARKATVIDYKTTVAVSIKQFGYSVKKYKYHIQASFYKTAVAQYLKQEYGCDFEVDFVFIPQNNHRHKKILGVVELSEDDMALAYKQWTTALSDLDHCLLTNDFETYPKDVNDRYVLKVFDNNYQSAEAAVMASQMVEDRSF